MVLNLDLAGQFRLNNPEEYYYLGNSCLLAQLIPPLLARSAA